MLRLFLTNRIVRMNNAPCVYRQHYRVRSVELSCRFTSAGITLRTDEKRRFFSLDDETSRKKTSLFSRPQFFFQGAKSDGKKNKFDTKFEAADFVRQLNGVNGYKLCLRQQRLYGTYGGKPMLFPRKAHRGTVFGVAHRGNDKQNCKDEVKKVKCKLNSRCALWSRLDQRASLPPLCVGLRVSRLGVPQV